MIPYFTPDIAASQTFIPKGGVNTTLFGAYDEPWYGPQHGRLPTRQHANPGH